METPHAAQPRSSEHIARLRRANRSEPAIGLPAGGDEAARGDAYSRAGNGAPDWTNCPTGFFQPAAGSSAGACRTARTSELVGAAAPATTGCRRAFNGKGRGDQPRPKTRRFFRASRPCLAGPASPCPAWLSPVFDRWPWSLDSGPLGRSSLNTWRWVLGAGSRLGQPRTKSNTTAPPCQGVSLAHLRPHLLAATAAICEGAPLYSLPTDLPTCPPIALGSAR
jgi:hypothetical protein